MKTKELIEKLEYKESSTVIHLDCRVRDKIIKRLEELEELKQCRVMTVNGKWERIKDIQLLSNIVKE